MGLAEEFHEPITPVRIFRWTPELDAKLLAALEAHPDNDIAVAAVLGVSLEAVRHRRIKRRILRRRPTNNGQWTEERIADLIRLRNEGYSAERIAERFGFTKSAVVGKAFRLKLPRLKRGVTPTEAKKERVYARPKVNIRRPRLVVDNAPDQDTPLEQRKSLLELTDNTCRWPVGDPREPGFFFCGADSGGFTYCPKHQARSRA